LVVGVPVVSKQRQSTRGVCAMKGESYEVRSRDVQTKRERVGTGMMIKRGHFDRGPGHDHQYQG